MSAVRDPRGNDPQMRMGLRVPLCRPIPEILALLKRADEGGIHDAWLPDSHMLWREVWSTMGAAATETQRIGLGTSVTNPKTRHFSVTASASATMAEATAGRFVLGLGSGDSAIKTLGLVPATVAEMRQTVLELRRLWTRQEPDGARTFLTHGVQRHVPIFIAASGPRMLELAGELADGVILHAGISPSTLSWAFDSLQRGLARRESHLQDLRVTAVLYCQLGEDIPAMRRQAHPAAAVWALRHWDRLFPEEERPPGAPDFGLHPDLNHAENLDAAIRATGWLSDATVDRFLNEHCLLGSPASIASQIRELAVRGVQSLHLRSFGSYELPADLCGALVEEIIPALQSNSPEVRAADQANA